MKTIVTKITVYKTYTYIERQDIRKTDERMLRVYFTKTHNTHKLIDGIINNNSQVMWERSVPYKQGEW